MPAETNLDAARREAKTMIWQGLRAFLPAVSATDPFSQAMSAYPPGPLTYDLRQGEPARMKRADLSHLQAGDIVELPGASLRIDDRGAPIASLRPGYETGRTAARTGPVVTPPGPPDASVDANIAMATGKGPIWFRQIVPKGAPWDYKRLDPKWEAFGNFNYGATGREIGFPTAILDQEAGRAQLRDRTTQSEWGQPGPHLAPFLGAGSYGDDPVDQFWIEEGARYHDQR